MAKSMKKNPQRSVGSLEKRSRWVRVLEDSLVVCVLSNALTLAAKEVCCEVEMFY